MMSQEERRIEREMDNFTYSLIPFGSADIKAAIITAMDAGKDGGWCAEQIEEYMDSCGISKLDEIDPVYVVYDSLLQEARNDIYELTDIDILNDTKEQIEVYGNYMCTSLDYSEGAKKELLKILKKVPKDEETDAIKWLVSELD